jgi:hypothetical protein
MMLFALAVLAQSRPDFTGVWQVNFDKSVIRGQVPKQILMKIEHREPKLVQTILVTSVADETQRLEFTFETTGKESVGPSGGTGRTRAHWDGSELAIESSLKASSSEFHFKDYWSLSKDGPGTHDGAPRRRSCGPDHCLRKGVAGGRSEVQSALGPFAGAHPRNPLDIRRHS